MLPVSLRERGTSGEGKPWTWASGGLVAAVVLQTPVNPCHLVGVTSTLKSRFLNCKRHVWEAIGTASCCPSP